MCFRLFFLAIFASLLTPVQATLMRLDFSGTIVGPVPFDGGPPIGEFSGYYILDTSVPDVNDSPVIGHYIQAVVEGSVNWNGLHIDLAVGSIFAGVNNNSGGDVNDVFYVLSSNLDEGTSFLFQLGDETEVVFSDDSLPTQLNLLDFDLLEIDNVNSTGAFVIIDAQISQGTIDFIGYRAVPVPGGLFLFVSGLMGTVAYSRRRVKVTHTYH